MRWPDLLIGSFLMLILFLLLLGSASSQEAAEGPVPNQLVLSIYIDEGGRCLINGYIEDPFSLPFLNSSEYSYEDESRQLYAITNALTFKSADNWSVRLESAGIFEEYRAIFYLPADAKLSGVEPSQGLDYLVYAADNSVVAELHGHDITNPAVDIGYALQLADKSVARENTSKAAGTGDVAGGSNSGADSMKYMTIALFILLLTALGLQIHSSRRRSESDGQGSLSTRDGVAAGRPPSSQGYSDHPLEDGSETSIEMAGGIEVSSDIAAVMATLTDKERAILKGLLHRGGRMTQREIGYEMDISRSSLSGILTSMERRKLITKRENGRTNIIELSERFSNNKERS